MRIDGPSLADPLADRRVFIQHRAQTLRIKPVVLIGLHAGLRKIEIVLAHADHNPLDRKTILFSVPDEATGARTSM